MQNSAIICETIDKNARDTKNVKVSRQLVEYFCPTGRTSYFADLLKLQKFRSKVENTV